MKHYDLIVIGGGPGGIEAARSGARSGLRTALVHNAPIGGRATWNSLLPSKAWLQIAETVRRRQVHPVLENPFKSPAAFDLEGMRTWIRATSEAQSGVQKAQLDRAGVVLIGGTAQWLAPGEIIVRNDTGERSLTYDHLILSAGSGPRFTPAIKPNMDRIIAPKLSPGLKEVPKSLIMIGGGVTGTEYAFAFASLGTKVIILQKNRQLLPLFDAEVIQRFTDYMARHLPIQVETGVVVTAAEQKGHKVHVTSASGQVYTADYGFIAMSRIPDLSFWPEVPETLRQTAGGFVQVDRWSRTSLPRVFAVGDITGAPMMANRARSQAREAVRAIWGQPDDSPAPVTAEAVYTQPNVVQIGDMQSQPDSTFKVLDWSGNLKAIINDYTPGFMRIHLHEETGRIRGAAAFGYYAAEVLALVQLAVNQGLNWDQLSRTPYAHPSLVEIFDGIS